MATGTAPPPSSGSPATSPLVGYDQIIEQQLTRTGRHLKAVDLVSSGILYLIGVLVFFLLVALLDHWVFGLGTWGRLFMFLAFIGGSGWFLATQVAKVVRRINPVYAAKVIEQSSPSLKNSLVNMLMFRPNGTPIHQMVFQALRQKAATDLTHVSVETSVDRSPLIKLGYVLAAVLAICAGYKILSPKDPLKTFSRVIAPWANIARPSRVQIEDLQPGNQSVFNGRTVKISAKIDTHGLRNPGPVTLFYSTLDGQVVDRPVPMNTSAESLRHEATLPPNGSGLQQDVIYYVVADDAISAKYRLTVIPAPTIMVDRVEYQYPSYAARPKHIQERQGDINALEGTRVSIFAKANQPIKTAYIEFDPPSPTTVAAKGAAASAKSDMLPMKFEGENASATFVLELGADRRTPKRSSYQVRFFTNEGHRNDPPILHQIQVIPDLPPEVEILTPATDRTDIAENGRQRIEIRAVDPDFGISKVTLRAVAGGNDVLTYDLLRDAKGQLGQTLVSYEFIPKDLLLKAGDEVTYWVNVEDNRTSPSSGLPEPNSQRTRNRVFRIVGADNSRRADDSRQDRNPANHGQQPPDESANSDPNKQGSGKQDPKSSKGGDQGGKASDADKSDSSKNNAQNQGNKNNPNADANSDSSNKGDQKSTPKTNSDSGNKDPNEQSSNNDNSSDKEKNKPGDKSAGSDNKNENSSGSKDGQGQQGGAGGSSKSDKKGEQQNSNGQGGKGEPGQNDSSSNDGSSEQNSSSSNSSSSGTKNSRGKNSSERNKQQSGSGGGKETSSNSNDKQSGEGARESNFGNNADTDTKNGSAQEAGGTKEGLPRAETRNADGSQNDSKDNSNARREAPHDGDVIEKALEHLRKQKEGNQQKENGSQQGSGEKQGKPDAQEQQGTKVKSDSKDAKANEGQGAESQGKRGQGSPENGDKNAAKKNDAGSKLDAGSNPSQKSPTEKQDQSGNGQNGEKAGGTPGEKPNAAQQPSKPSNEDGAKPEKSVGPPSQESSGQTSDQSQDKNKANGSGGNPMNQDGAGGKPQGPADPMGEGAGQKTGNGTKPTPGKGDDGQVGAGQDNKNAGGSPEAQDTNQDRNKKPSDSSPQSKDGSEATSPSNSKRQSDSQGNDDGTESGGGGKGSGQSGNQAGNDGKGKNSPGDEGASQANERGKGDDSNRAGNQKNASTKTGQPGKEKGEGSSSTPSNDPANKSSDASKTPGASKNPGANSGAPNGGGLPADNSPPANVKEPEVPDGDAANLEYARKATDLAIEHLKNQKDNPDRELLDKLGWTKEDLRRFLERWEGMKKTAGDAKNKDASRDMDETLRSLGLRPQRDMKRGSGATSDGQRGNRDAGTRSAPPSSYQEQFNAFRKGTTRAKDE